VCSQRHVQEKHVGCCLRGPRWTASRSVWQTSGVTSLIWATKLSEDLAGGSTLDAGTATPYLLRCGGTQSSSVVVSKAAQTGQWSETPSSDSGQPRPTALSAGVPVPNSAVSSSPV